MTLRDFKTAVDRHGCFRYHFKALDPEFGTVKEEVGLEVQLQTLSFQIGSSSKFKLRYYYYNSRSSTELLFRMRVPV